MSEKNKVYIEDFDDGSGGWEEYPNPLLIEDSCAITKSPWWVDSNHAPPGGGYLHLLYCLYTSKESQNQRDGDDFHHKPLGLKNKFLEGNHPNDWTNVSITVRIKGDIKMKGTELVLLAQSSVGTHTQNHVLTGQPIKVTKEWTEQTITLVPDQAQWTSLGSRHNRVNFYGHGNIADVLKDLNVDIIFVLHPLLIVPKEKSDLDQIHSLSAGSDYEVDQGYLPEGHIMLDQVKIEFP